MACARLGWEGSRERTKPVALTAEPDLDDGFLFRLQPADNQPLSSLAARLHIVVVKQVRQAPALAEARRQFSFILRQDVCSGCQCYPRARFERRGTVSL